MVRILVVVLSVPCFFFFSSRRRHTRSLCDWSSDVCSSDLTAPGSSILGSFLGAAFITLFPILLSVASKALEVAFGIELPGAVVSNVEAIIFGRDRKSVV